MSKANSTAKPAKPYADFPLFPHATLRWAKKVRGKMHYFGSWARRVNGKLERIEGDGWQEALEQYRAVAADLHAGRTPRATSSDGCAVRELCNRFLTSKKHLLDIKELSPRTFRDYFDACKIIVDKFGASRLVADLRPEDFESLKVGLPKTWGPQRRGKTIQMVRCVFRYAVDEDLVDRAVKLGKQFRPPSKKTLRLHRAENGPRMFEAAELRRILEAAGPQLKAMVLLGCNCAFGNTDVATLPQSALDLKDGWVNFSRQKTGINRRCPLWSETVTAIREAIAKRQAPVDASDSDLVFITKFGRAWVKVVQTEGADGKVNVACDDAVSKETSKLLRKLGINGRRSFYTLRHTFRTIADECRDQPAIDHIMGHVRDDMASVYRERISDERLKAVTDFVRNWVFPPPHA
jgi:integrase